MNMTNNVNLQQLFAGLQEEMCAVLNANRKTVLHSTAKGDGTELCWVEMLSNYLPKRYEVRKAFVIDSKGDISEQMDIVIFDRQYSPFLFNHLGVYYVPAESVYAVFESKQDLSKYNIEYAGKKAESVRKLVRTNAPVPHAGGTFSARPLFPIMSGILTLGSEWNPPLGNSFNDAVKNLVYEQRIDIGCCLEGGAFETVYDNSNQFKNIDVKDQNNALIFFFLRLFEKLQSLATVPAIEISEYTKFIK
jgi:spore maturation protein CgeB